MQAMQKESRPGIITSTVIKLANYFFYRLLTNADDNRISKIKYFTREFYEKSIR